MDTLFADSEADKLIDDARVNSTIRLVGGLTRAKEVCRDFVNSGIALTHVNIGKECKKRFNKGPLKGTLDNDTNGYYHKLIKLYQDLVVPSIKFDDDGLDELPIDIKTHIKNLESRNTLLEKLTKEKFAKARRTEVVSITDTIESHDGLSDHARTVQSTGTLAPDIKEAFTKLYQAIEYAEDELDFVGKEGNQRLVSKSTGVIILEPKNIKTIKDVLGLS